MAKLAGLSETLSRLAKHRREFPHPGLSDDGRLTELDDFGSNPGSLRARLYVPTKLQAGAPLVVVLHGCTQNAAGYDLGSGWSAMADRHGFALLFPEQRRANNPNLCFNWFAPQHMQRGQGEPQSIAQMVQTVTARHAIDPARVFVTGLSAGGAMTAVMLATYPDLFAAGAIIAGLPYGIATSVPQALEMMRSPGRLDGKALAAKVRAASDHSGPWPRLSVWHGASDQTVAAANTDAIVAQWLALHGLPPQPSETGKVSGFPRRTWRDAQGREAVEEYIIPGMGHGTPLDTSTGHGTAAAFMLDVGISSTQQICRFWGIAEDQPERASAPNAALTLAPTQPPKTRRPQRLEETTPPRVGPGAVNVTKVIEDALRAAGLMR